MRSIGLQRRPGEMCYSFHVCLLCKHRNIGTGWDFSVRHKLPDLLCLYVQKNKAKATVQLCTNNVAGILNC